MRRLTSWALFALMLLFCLPAVAQIFQNDGNTPDTSLGTSAVRRNRYSVSGDVRNATTDSPFEKVQVNIRSDDGSTFFATLTDENGRFAFDSLPRGNYTVTSALIGYQAEEERVDVENGPALGVQLRLRTINGTANTPQDSAPAISAHELTAPSKARDDMAKGESLLYDKSDFQASIREFQRAVKEFPNYYEAYAQMGMAYIGLKDFANAEASLRKSLDLSGQKYPRAYLFMATLFSDNHRFSDAEPMARKELDLDSNSWQGYSELARALAGLNRLPEAEESAQAAIKLNPEEPELYLALVNIEGKLPNYPAMLSTMDDYLRLAPDGRAAQQIRNMRSQVRQALAKPAASSPRTQDGASDSKP